MDEPTAAISVRQVAELLELIRRLKSRGVSVISHCMPDVFSVCDRIIVPGVAQKWPTRKPQRPRRNKSPA
jgi:ABC-type sugar transport system ATPase subunit